VKIMETIRRLTLVFVSATILACSAGCAGQISTEDKQTSPPSTATTIGPLPLATRISVTDPTLPWHLIETQDRRLLISSEQHGCRVPEAVHVNETDAEVSVSFIAIQEAQPCAASKTFIVGYVVLKQPIGNRKVVHAQLQP